MKRSSKFKLADNNHRLYTCNDEEVFEIIYQSPFEMLRMISNQMLNFTGVENTSSDLLSEKVENKVQELDSATLAQNVAAPYLFVTLRRYADEKGQ